MTVAGRAWRASTCAVALVAVWACALPAGASAAKARPSVVGGSPAALADYGFTVAVLQDGRFICSGSVISPTRVLTAAHCATVSATRLTVVAGRTAIGSTGGEVIGVTGASTHPDNNQRTFLHDMAVLALASPTSSPVIQLATPEEDAATTALGAPLSVAGFGRRNPFGFGKPKGGLLFAAGLFARPGCKKYGPRFDPALMICANGAQFRRQFRVRLMRSACPGDSGGPLIAQTPSGIRQVGVVSFGLSTPFILCAEKGFPGVFGRIAPNLPFLQPFT
jgi:trypsin